MRITLGSAIVCFGIGLFVLPALGTQVFLSPDETAVAVAARRAATTASFRIERVASFESFPWLHPRSFVVNREAIVPVGFLGMPILMAGIARVFGDAGMALATPLLVLSAVIPLLLFSREWGKLGRLATVTAWLTFPTVILYANRGLFPNLAVVCLALWAVWMIQRTSSPSALMGSGLLAGIALAIRPTEAAWVFPWLVVARLQAETSRPTLADRRRDLLRFFLPFFVVVGVAAFIGFRTYGSWFVSGYQLRDPVFLGDATAVRSASRSWFESWPFGFHPRNVWWNIRSYLLVYLWPWAVLLGFVYFLHIHQAMVGSASATGGTERGTPSARRPTGRGRWGWAVTGPVGISLWTIAVLSLVYGQAIYQDHVRLNEVSIGNSFLRYLVPTAPIAALALGWLVGRIRQHGGAVGAPVAGMLIALAATFGIWTAFVRDDEGLIRNRVELARYDEIRRRAEGALPSDAIVLSERSDKIFFPMFQAASPLPPRTEIRRAAAAFPESVVLFIRTQDALGIRSWENDGLALAPILTSGNETLYRVSAVVP
ncbi:hypothetical protein HY479_02485 [Candidatus Uhrbacteria bacterium]|nr:hypothetical protein [Candidatus Uhrbacteria bacterium]